MEKRERVGVLALGFSGTSMGETTGVPLGVGLELLLRGEITRRGVFAPEAGIDPDDFFAAFAPSTRNAGSGQSAGGIVRSSDSDAPERYRSLLQSAVDAWRGS